jgi:protein-disulfide isomerase
MNRNIIIAAIALIVVAIGGWFVMAPTDNPPVPPIPPAATEPATDSGAETETPADTATGADETDQAATDETAPIEIKEMALGAEDAPVTIIEYASFTCPHCANFHRDVFGKIKAEYIDTGKVRFILRDVYFDRFGLWAAMVARCGDGSKYFGMADLIFDNQKEWTKGETNGQIVDNLMKLGRLAGMDDDQMDACLKNEAMAQALVLDYQTNAEKDEITGTPSFIINGEKQSNMPFDGFKTLLDGLLAE